MRFIHIADVHLGAAPDADFPWARDRGKELWDAFRRCIADANEKKADLLLVAGDLFDREPTLLELKEVNYLFSTLEKTLVVLIAGNHDYLRPGSPVPGFRWNKNVVFLSSVECEKVRFPEIKTEVYGMSYHSPEIREPVYDSMRAEKGDYYQILLAHGGDEKHIPISKAALEKAGFDYIAMGHLHRPQVFVEGLALYAGALEPIDGEDTGPHGYVLGEVRKNRVELSFTEIARRQYRKEKLEITEADNAYSAREKLIRLVRGLGEENIYRIRLTGSRDPRFSPEPGELMKCGRILELEDETVPAFHYDQLRRQYEGRLIGNFIESFGTGPKNELEEKALRYGLEALLRENHS